MAKCPKCEKSITPKAEATALPPTINTKGLNVVVFSCPTIGCGIILSVAPDPYSTHAAIAREVAKLLKK